MEQACWHSGVDAAMGFCVVDWGGKDLGTTRVSGFWERSRGIWCLPGGLGALCARREGGMGSLRSGLRPVAFGDAPSRRFAPLGRTGGFE